MTTEELRARFVQLFQEQRPLTEPDLTAIGVLLDKADPKAAADRKAAAEKQAAETAEKQTGTEKIATAAAKAPAPPQPQPTRPAGR